MSKPKILCVFGTRPEAIKLAPVIRELQKHRRELSTRICVTAQHRGMLDQVLRLFGIRSHHDLDIMRRGQTLHDLTGRVLQRVGRVVAEESPDLVVVQGDTTTTFATALAAFYAGVPVAHVEAGLRTRDMRHPYPEEMNRVLTSHLVSLHFAPTNEAKKNLLAEGISRSSIHVTGNPVVDALLSIRETLSGKHHETLLRGIGSRRIILVTGHRRESFGAGFQNICRAIRSIAFGDPEVEIIYPVHLNPNVRQPVQRILSGIPNVHLIEPLEYDQFVYLMSRSYLILTDSGGVQEEAPSLGKPVLVMRDVTERPEGVRAGTVRLVGTEEEQIVREVRRLLANSYAYRRMCRAHNPYGDGKAARRIVGILRRSLA